MESLIDTTFGSKRIAMLIDGENAQSSLIDKMVAETGKYGLVTVRRIYDLFTTERRSEAQIASILNTEGIPNEVGKPWTRGAIHELLTNEKVHWEQPLQPH